MTNVPLLCIWSRITIATQDLQTKNSCTKNSCMKRRCFRGVSANFWIRPATWLHSVHDMAVRTTWFVWCTTWLGPGNPSAPLGLNSSYDIHSATRLISNWPKSFSTLTRTTSGNLHPFAPLGLQFLARTLSSNLLWEQARLFKNSCSVVEQKTCIVKYIYSNV